MNQEDRFRQAHDEQLELFPEEKPQTNYFVFFVRLALLVVVILLAGQALAGITTHACKTTEEAFRLTDILTKEGPIAYEKEIEPHLASGECVIVSLPDVPPGAVSLYTTHNGQFSAGVYSVHANDIDWYAILINDLRKHPKFAQSI